MVRSVQCSAKTPGQPAVTGSAGHDMDGVSIAVQPAANEVLSGASRWRKPSNVHYGVAALLFQVSSCALKPRSSWAQIIWAELFGGSACSRVRHLSLH